MGSQLPRPKKKAKVTSKRRRAPSPSEELVAEIRKLRGDIQVEPERPEAPADDLVWLSWLDDDVWLDHPAEGYNRNGWSEVHRGFTKNEKERVLRIIQERKLIVQVGSGTYGLSGYSVCLRSHPEYPSLPVTYLVHFTDEHWFGLTHKRDYDKRGERFDEFWTIFSAFSHSEQNKEWLKQYGLDAPRERSYYDY